MMLFVVYILFIYVTLISVYLFVFSIAGKFYRSPKLSASINKKKIAVLIPSYNEDLVIISTARSAAAHDYPKEYFDVYIAADKTSNDTILELQQLNVAVFPVQFERGSKAKSLNFLLNTIEEQRYDIALVLDGDNIMTPGFLEKINTAFQHGAASVQAHRTAKNKNSPIAYLDAVSEEVNNHLFRRSQRALGFSAATIGSGMAFSFSKLKEVYNKPGIIDNPACDREVDFEMMKANIVVEYLDEALLLDEKVSRRDIFENQRRRWLESQLFHLGLFFSSKEKVKHKRKDYWNKLFINLIPPRILLLGIFLILIFFVPIIYWLIVFSLYITAMLLSIPSGLYTRKFIKSISYLPVIIISYFKAVIGLKPQRKEFIHTPKIFSDSKGTEPH